MGSYIYSSGKANIPENKKADLEMNLLNLARSGGMIQFSTVEIHNRRIRLMNKVEPEADGSLHFFYNYFRDESWEGAGYKHDGRMWSCKVGNSAFARVLLAMYSLEELYSVDKYLIKWDGDLIETESYGWLKYILGEEEPPSWCRDIWPYFEEKYIGRSEKEDDTYSIEDIAAELQNTAFIFNPMNPAGYFEMLVIGATKQEFEKEHIDTNAEKIYPFDYLVYGYRALHRLKEEMQDDSRFYEAAVEYAVDITEDNLEENLESIPYLFAYAGTKFAAKIISVVMDMPYRDVYLDIRERGVLHAGLVKEMLDVYKKLKPEPETTQSYLNISDDDMAYYWQENGDIMFSEELKAFYQGVSEQYHEILNATEIKQYNMKAIMELLEKVETDFREIYIDRDFFYLLVEHFHERKYQAMLGLIQFYYERLQANVKEEIEEAKKNYCFYRLHLIPTRRKMKQFMAMLNNPALRSKVLEGG